MRTNMKSPATDAYRGAQRSSILHFGFCHTILSRFHAVASSVISQEDRCASLGGSIGLFPGGRMIPS